MNLKIGKVNLFRCLTALALLLLILLISTKPVQASCSLRPYTLKVLRQAHLKGSVLLIKNKHTEQVNSGYGYYKRRLLNGSRKLVYPLGSLQKELTAAMITQLIFQGKFSQKTKISRWFHMKNARQITVGQLLTHTSGLNISGTESNHGWHFSEAGAIRWAEAQIDFTPRQGTNSFNYNNANYILLAGIIRKVTGQSYRANLKKRILKPCHLRHTFVYDDISREITDAISYRYLADKNYQEPVYANTNVASQMVGAGDVFSTPRDYYRIQLGMTNGKILSREEFRYMTHLQARKSTYSGGVYLKKKWTLRLAYGNFSNTHFANWMQITNDQRNGLIMFLNQTQDNKFQNKAAAYRILRRIKARTFIRR